MTGEELLDYVRFRVADHGLENYVLGNRALQEYCSHTGFTWLRDVEGAAIRFQADKVEYPIHEFGLRRIDHIWVQDSDSGEWTLLTELTPQGFEEYVQDVTADDGTEDADPPARYCLQGPNLLTLRISPTPSQAYEGRVSGIANTPAIERLKELPGPSEYHRIVGDLWAGMQLEHEALTRIKTTTSQDGLLIAQGLDAKGKGMQETARAGMHKVVRDTFPNRTGNLRWKKVPLAR